MQQQKQRRILITRTDRMGDVILSTPAIKAVRDKYPDAYIAFCVQPSCVEIVDKNPYLNEIISYDKKGKYRNIIGILRFILKLRRKKIDTVFILHPTARMNLSCFLAGIPRRVGYNKKMGYLLTDKIPHTKQEGQKHELEYTLDVLRYAGIEAEDKRLYMSLHKNTERQVEEVFGKYNIEGSHKIISIHPDASCPSKKWPYDYFMETALYLQKKFNAKIIILGEKKNNKDICNVDELKAVDLRGKTSVSQLAGILSKSVLLISNDSGPVHAAVSVGTPVIAIFGRKDPGLSSKRWGPLGKMDIVLHKDAGCGKCLAHLCDKEFKCLKLITPQEVIKQAEKLL